MHEGERFFAARGLTGKIATDVAFNVHRGGVVGLTGLVGMGQDEVLYLVYGSTGDGAGAVTVGANTIARPTPEIMRKAGVALLPADRTRASGTLSASVLENVTLPVLGRFFSGGFLHHGAERTEVLRLLTRFNVRPPLPQAPFASLSGGNQQKALLAKWLQLRPAGPASPRADPGRGRRLAQTDVRDHPRGGRVGHRRRDRLSGVRGACAALQPRARDAARPPRRRADGR